MSRGAAATATLFEPAVPPPVRPEAGHRPLTQEQRAAVGDRSGPLFLFAGAGSGKTTVMVERFVRAVLDDGRDPGRILAITFTEKAAAELRARLRARLVEVGEDAVARAVDAAPVGTIHGFCAGVLRAHPLAAGLDPRFVVLDEHEAERLATEAFESALALWAKEGGDAAVDLLAAYGHARLRRMMRGAHARLRSRGEARPRLAIPAAPDPAPARRRLLAAREEAAAALAGGRALKRLDEARAALARAADLLEGSEPGDLPLPADLAALAFAPGNTRELREGAGADYLAALEPYRQVCADARAAAAVALLDALLTRFEDDYRARKRAGSAVDFEDLELSCMTLLREDRGLRAEVAGRFDMIMVDEFQDTNGVQLGILRLLDRGNLCTVGDELQSIYAFRHADVAIFRARRDELSGAGRTRRLAANFRSEPRVLDAVNLAAASLFPGHDAPLAAGRPEAGRGGEPRVEVLLTDCEGWEASPEGAPGHWREAEAALLAQRVAELAGDPASPHRPGEVVVLVRGATDLALYERALVDRGLPTSVVGAGGFWGAAEVRELLACLAVVANPRDEPALYELLRSPMVGASADALALIAQAAHALGRRAWWTLEEALGPGGDGSGGLAARLPGDDRERLSRALEWVGQERGRAARGPLAGVVARALEREGYDRVLLAMPGGERRLANARKLLRLVGDWEAERGPDLRGFLDAARAREGAGAREGEAPVEGEALDAVRLMTIHRAKGLEFPVVCVADLGRAPRRDDDDLLVGRDGRIGLRLVSLDGGPSVKALAFDDLAAAEREAREEEERRILYVAMTRARERLLLSGGLPCERWPEDERTMVPPLAWLGPAVAGAELRDLDAERPERIVERRREGRPVRVRCLLNAPATVGRVLRPVPAAPAPAGLRPVGTPLPAAPPQRPGEDAARGAPPVDRVSYTSLEDYGRCGYRFLLQRVLRLPEDDDDLAGAPAPEADAEHLLPAALRGILAHALLERADLGRPFAPRDPELRVLAAEHGVSASALAPVVALVAGFWPSPVRRRLARAPEVHAEYPFAFLLDQDPGPPTLVGGVVDVLAREADGTALVVDYKTDRVAGRELGAVVSESYRTQRLTYALAALRAGAQAVEVVHAFLERPLEPVLERFTPAHLPAVEQELRSLTAGLRAGRYPVTDTPHRDLCRACPGRRALCSWGPEMTGREPPGSSIRVAAGRLPPEQPVLSARGAAGSPG